MNFTVTEQALHAVTGRTQFKIGGRYFRLLETLNPVDVEIGRSGQHYEKLAGVEAGAWARLKAADEDFDTIVVTGTAGATVKFVVTDGEAGYDRLFTAVAQATSMALPGNAAVGVAEGVVLAAGSRRKVIFQADSGNAGVIALGPAGVTLANSPIILNPGDIWIEEVAASAAWSAIASVAAQTLRILYSS